jgi:hypothetical protein
LTGPNQIRNAILALGAAVIILAAALLFASAIKGPSPESVRNSQLELRDKLVWSCEFEETPLREILQSMIREDIRSSAKVRPSYFPDIPPKVLHRLVSAQLASKRRQLKRAAPIDCEGLFPPP